MTPTQKRCLDAIGSRIEATGCAPTIRELADMLGHSSTTSTWRLVCELEAQGRIRRRPDRARSIELVAENGATPSVDAAAREVVRRWLAGTLTGQALAALKEALGPEPALSTPFPSNLRSGRDDG